MGILGGQILEVALTGSVDGAAQKIIMQVCPFLETGPCDEIVLASPTIEVNFVRFIVKAQMQSHSPFSVDALNIASTVHT